GLRIHLRSPDDKPVLARPKTRERTQPAWSGPRRRPGRGVNICEIVRTPDGCSNLRMNRVLVAASRQSAADCSSNELRRSAETPLRQDAWSRCAVAKPWRLPLNFAAQISAVASGFYL